MNMTTLEGGIKIIELIYYSNQLENKDIKELILGNKDYTYIFATKALENKRLEIIPNHQQFKVDQSQIKKIGIFNGYLEKLIKEEINVATFGETKTLLNRAVKIVFDDNLKLKNVFQKDIVTWLNTMSYLAVKGIDFSQGLSIQVQNKLKSKCISDLLFTAMDKLQQKFYEVLKDEKKEFFSKAVHKYLEYHYEPTEVVIMEGFTYLTELQKYYVEKMKEKGVQIIFIVPYNKEQKRGFAIIDETYSRFKNLQWREIETSKATRNKELEFLQKNLFANQPERKRFSCTDDVKLNKYTNRELEIRSCIDQLRTWFKEGYKPKEVAVVMRNLDDFKDILDDYLAIESLKYYNEQVREWLQVEVYTPPRLLLLTPLGRFVLSLYNIWIEGNLEISADELETILASGWLGASLQDSARIFRMLKEQYFLQCKSKDEWFAVFDQLLIDLKNGYIYDYLPISLLNNDRQIHDWKEVLSGLEKVCNNLFSSGKESISEHIQRLQNELELLMPEQIRSTEREVLKKIKEVFNELKESHSISLSTEEFSEAINALSSERPELEEEFDPESDRLQLMLPEQIDNISYKCVIYIGLDNQRIPSSAPTPWPLYYDNRQEQVKKERYMFLTVIKSATEKLVLSYAQNDGNISLEPSIYLKNAAYLLDEQIEFKDLARDLNINEIKELNYNPAPGIMKNQYCFDELIHYGLCPLRYRLGKLDPEGKTYRNRLQLKFLAQGIWLDRMFTHLRKYSNQNGAIDKNDRNRWQVFREAINEVKEGVHNHFPSFTEVEWNDVSNQIENSDLSFLINNKYKEKYNKVFLLEIQEGVSDCFNLLLDDESERNIKIEWETPHSILKGKYKYPELRSKRYLEWLIYSKKPDGLDDTNLIESLRPAKEVGKVQLFESQYKAVKWWLYTLRGVYRKLADETHENEYTEFYDASKPVLKNWINCIEDAKFPRNPGEHCSYCPVKPECLGIDKEVNSYGNI